MKKALFACFVSVFAIAGARADLFWLDTMDYPEGDITTNSSGLWVRHSGSGGNSLVVAYPGSPAALAGNRYEVNQTRTDDIRRWFDPVSTNGYLSGDLWASFIVSVTNLPSNTGGTYFAHFADTGTNSFGTQFRGRIFTVVPTNDYPYTTTVPGTFRFGVANAQGDSSYNTNGPTAIVPMDLALNTDYQVVLKYEIDNARCVIWVNPASEFDVENNSGFAYDIGSVTSPLSCFCFRQALGEGVLEMRDVAVGTSFADVVTATPSIPVIGLQPAGVTNYSGNAAILEVAASGMGVLTYQWYKDDSPLFGATSQAYVISSLQGTDEGAYYCEIGNTAGTATSASAYVSVNTTPTAPTFVEQPQNTTNSVGGLATLTCRAVGTGPLSFQWNYNGTPMVDGPSTIPGDLSVVSGSQTPILTIANLSINESGNYTVTVSGGAGTPATSDSAYLEVQPPNPVTIAYLRSLLDPSTWQPTDTTTMFTITGVITTFTNLTSGNTSSYFIQDDTAGINLFVVGTGATAFRPQQGDVVKATGTLLNYNNNLELQCQMSNPYQTHEVIGHSDLPAPFVFAPDLTNNPSLMETNLEGRYVMLTNATFVDQRTISGTTTVVATNSSGEPIIIYFSAQNQDVAGHTLPGFCWTISGVLSQYKSGSYANSGYELNVTRWADIVTDPPPAATVAESLVGNDVTLTWEAVPYTYSYSVLGATDIAGPWEAVATGLTFTTSDGRFVDVSPAGTKKFYKLSSP